MFIPESSSSQFDPFDPFDPVDVEHAVKVEHAV
jgi:hypothetical protein